MKRLQKGDVLVKQRGGASRRARVVRVWIGEGAMFAELEALAPSAHARGRNEKVRRWTVALGEDGLPDGWRRSTVEHDWRGGVCSRAGCGARATSFDGRVRYRRAGGKLTLKCPPCEGKP